MLKTVIESRHNTNIKSGRLTTFLKRNETGYEPKKSKVFLPEEIRRFLTQADDKTYLAAKVRTLQNISAILQYCFVGYYDIWDVWCSKRR